MVSIPGGEAVRPILTWIAILVVFHAGVYGCARRTEVPSAAVFRSPLTIEPAGLDPARVFDSVTGGLLQNVFEGLVEIDKENPPPLLDQGA